MAAEADAETPNRLRPCGIAVHDVATNNMVSSGVLDAPSGRVMPIGVTHVAALHKHPHLIRLSDGAVEHSWAELSGGNGDLSSLIQRLTLTPVALVPANARFAIAQEGGIHVVSLRLPGTSASPAGH